VFGRKAPLQPEPLISPGLLNDTIWMISDIRDELRKIRRLLEEEDDGEEEGPKNDA